MEHRLIGGTLSGEDKGVIARCECGWDSGHRFSSFGASNAWTDHLEEAARETSTQNRRQSVGLWK